MFLYPLFTISILFISTVQVTLARELIQNYYLGDYENRQKMSLLFRHSQRTNSRSGREEWLVETLTYPLNMGPYGGQVGAVRVQVALTTSPAGRLTITAGGIDSTSFELVVEADLTRYLVCNYTVYGKEPFTRTNRIKIPRKSRIRIRDEL